MGAAFANAPAVPPRSMAWVDPYLVVASLAAAALLVASAVGLVRVAPTALDPWRWALVAALACGSYLVLRGLLLFDWRGHRVALAPDEALVFIALLALPLQAVVLFPVPAMAAYQIVTRRPLLKGAFNVATVVLAGGAGAAAFGALVDLGLPPLAAAPPALVLYTGLTHLLVAGVFAFREGTPVHVVFGERFWVPTLLHLALGIAGGFALVGLWRFHPAAVLALAPFLWLAREHTRLRARAEREAQALKSLRDTTRALAGERDLARAARRIVDASGAIFQAGRVEMVLGDGVREERFANDFEEGPRAGARPLAAPLPATGGGAAGALVLHPSSRTHEKYGEHDAALLALVAEEAAVAIANARALRDLDAARARLEALLATASDGVLLVGVDGVVRYANRAGRAMLGLREGPATARDLFEDLAFLGDAAQGRSVGRLYETQARSVERRFPVEVSAAPVRDEEGELVLVIVRDATDRHAAQDALLAQRVSRPLVRRIVRDLMEETGANALVLMHLGQRLAEGIDARGIPDQLRAYAEMGLGALRATATEGARHEFAGDDLLERAPGSRATTCYLALGFLCGAVSRASGGADARGTEVSCVSRGDAACRFVVHAKPESGRTG